MSATAVITAGGTGSRFGHKTPKQFLPLLGVPLIVHTLRAFERASRIHEVVVVLPAAELHRLSDSERDRFGLKKVRAVVTGGATRQESVGCGLEAIQWDCSVAAVHDAARCLITSEVIDSAIAALSGWDGVIVALPVRDTLKRTEKDRILHTEARENVWAMQTPQIFPFPWIREAYRKAARTGLQATDDSQVAENAGGKIRVFQGNTRNLKVTYPEDLELAEAILAKEKTQ